MSQVEEQTVADNEIVANNSSAPEEATLDTGENSTQQASEQTADSANAVPDKKVELDLEEAPFLEEEKEEAPATEKSADESSTSQTGEEEGKGKKKFQLTKKKLIIIVGGLLIVIIAAVAVLFLTGGGEETPKEVEATEEVEEAEAPELEPFVVVVEEFKEPEGPPIYTLELEPFWIQMKNETSETIFLVCNFSLVTEDMTFYNEIQANIPVIRDTIYYYLNSRTHQFLTNHENFPLIKENLLTLINRLLKQDQLSEVLYNSYLTK